MLAVIGGVAILLRLFSALYQGNTVDSLPGVYDQLSYHELAGRVISGHGFSFAEGHWPATRAGEPTAHWSYLYTLYLGGIYALFGVQPVVARILQALAAGILHTLLIWRLGNRVFGPAVGLAAAALSAVYIYLFYYAGALVTETFYVIGILWVLDIAFRLADAPADAAAPPGRRRLWIELGLALGLTALLRQVFLLFAPFLYLWIWWNKPVRPASSLSSNVAARRLRLSSVAGLAGATALLAALILPFSIRNYRAFGTAVPLNTNAGFAFFWGNHPVHGSEFLPLLGNDTYGNLIPDELRSLNEAELDKALLRIGLQYVMDEPGRFALLSLSRAKEYFKFWPTAESGLLSNVSRVASFGLALPFIVLGVGLSIPLLRPAARRRNAPLRPQQPAQILLLCLFVLIYTGIHLASWTLVRYRLPVDAVLLLFAAYAVVVLARRGRLIGPDPAM